MRKLGTSITLDADAIKLLAMLAAEHENNVSQTVRYIVKEAARARGLVSEGVNNGR